MKESTPDILMCMKLMVSKLSIIVQLKSHPTPSGMTLQDMKDRKICEIILNKRELSSSPVLLSLSLAKDLRNCAIHRL